MINTHQLELPLSRTYFHGSKGVRAIEVLQNICRNFGIHAAACLVSGLGGCGGSCVRSFSLRGRAMVLGNPQCWCILLIGIIVGQGPSVLARIFLSLLSPSL